MISTSDTRTEVIIDGDSVAYDGQEEPNTENLRLASYWCRDNRDIVKGTIVVGAKLRYKVNNRWDYEEMIKRGFVKQVPAGYEADMFILEYAKRHPKAFVVSKDLFRDYKNTSLKIEKKRVWGFMIIQRDFLVPDLDTMVQTIDVDQKN